MLIKSDRKYTYFYQMVQKGLIGCVLLILFCIHNHAQLEISPAEFKFGSVKSGEIVIATFTLSNPTDNLVNVGKITAGCGCTKITKVPKSLKPGKSFDLQVKLNTSGYLGSISKAIYVYDKNAKSRQVLRIEGSILPKPTGKLELETQKIDFGKIRKGKKVKKKIKVTNIGDAKLEILQFAQPPFLQINFSKIFLKPGESGDLTITTLPTIYGKQTKTIGITTNAIIKRSQWLTVSFESK